MDFLCACAWSPTEWVLCFFSRQSFILSEYTGTFVMHMVYDILVVGVVVFFQKSL